MQRELPKIGTAIVIFNNLNQILFGKRIYNPVGYQVPGGHIEFLETIEHCVKREALEEAGVEVENIQIKTIGENIYPEQNFHSITVFAFCSIKQGATPSNMEPEKCAGWSWYDIDNLPSNFAFNYKPILKDNKKLLKDYINKRNSNDN